MLTRTFLVSGAICIAASYGVYYEQSKYDPIAEKQENIAVLEQLARHDAARFMEDQRRCWAGNPTGSTYCDSFTYAQLLQNSRDYYLYKNSFNFVNHTTSRNQYFLIAAVSGLVAFFQLRRRAP